MTCICGTAGPTESCCGALIDGRQPAETAEQLMRSRYAAWTLSRIDYLHATHDPETVETFDRTDAARWAASASWQGLEIVDTEAGGPEDATGMVEFVVRYATDGTKRVLRERSDFRKHEGRWVYVGGETPKSDPIRRKNKVGRNDKCPCGSGKKYKRCCMS